MLHGPADELLVVTVWRLHATLGIPVSVEAERAAAEEAAAQAVALAEEVGFESEVSIRRGRPGEEICAAARERDVRMIVVGSRGAGRVEGVLLGSVSAYVIRHAPCPVLVVRAAPDPIECDHARRAGISTPA